MKKCSECEKSLPESMFHNHRRSHDGLFGMCKLCRSETRKSPEETKVRNKAKWDKKLRVNILSNVDAAYIAGFLDGEGSVALKVSRSNKGDGKTTCALSVTITNTFPGIMDWISMKVGYGFVHKKKKYDFQNKDSWLWRISGRRAVHLLEQLSLYLIVKKLQACVAFEYNKTISTPGQCKLDDKVIRFREELRTKMKYLNH